MITPPSTDGSTDGTDATGFSPRGLRRVLLALVASFGLAWTLLAAPAAAGPVIDLTPGEYPRGPETPEPHVTGTTIIHGDTRIRLDVGQLDLLGVSEESYIVLAAGTHGGHPRLLRVAPNGGRTVLLRGPATHEARLDANGRRIVTVRDVRGPDVRVDIRSARTGAWWKSRTVTAQSASVLDVDHGRIVLSTWGEPRTFVWNAPQGTTRMLSHRHGSVADLSADRFGDLRHGTSQNCSRVAAISAPRRTLWRSCRERAEAFAPHGNQMLTVHINADGLGARTLRQRGIRGRLLQTYHGYAITDQGWAPSGGLLFTVLGPVNRALMHCGPQECGRVSALAPHGL